MRCRVSQRFGKYDVLAHLQRGGMAELMLGATAGMGGFRKYVVIKRILPEASSDENFVRMFLDEARVTAAFSHPNICQTYDLGDDGEGGLYVALEFIAGQDLNQVVTACATQQAVLPLGFSVSVVHDCALALHYAHTFKLPNGEDSPVIHRDVAQKNIMVTYDGQVKLLDFGIAKARGALAHTRAGTVKGTAGYMSPEQVRGEVIDGRSDVFALGVVLWEMSTGQRLFSAETELAELRMILSEPIRPPDEVEPSVPPELSAVVMKALERDLSQRYRSARELARALTTDCARLMFDAEERADFMGQRFEAKIASTRRLFDVAASSDAGELKDAVKAFQNIRDTDEGAAPPAAQAPKRARAVGATVSDPRMRALSNVKLKPVRSKVSHKKLEKVVDPGVTEAVAAALAAELPEEVPRKPMWPMVALAAVAALGVGALVWYGVQHGAGEAPMHDLATINEVKPLAPPKPLSDLEEEEEEVPEAPPIVQPPPRAKGEVSLALIPEATVSKGGQKLASGSFVTFTLPVGTHLVTVTGTDGVRRNLSLKVTAGKNKAQRFKVEDLPTE